MKFALKVLLVLAGLALCAGGGPCCKGLCMADCETGSCAPTVGDSGNPGDLAACLQGCRNWCYGEGCDGFIGTDPDGTENGEWDCTWGCSRIR